MQFVDVTRNRHLESIGQEIRVRHDFLPRFFLLPFVYIMVYVSMSHKVYVQIGQTICSKNCVNKAMSTP